VTATDAVAPAVAARLLADAIPYIREFAGRTVVVKYGGNAMGDDETARRFASDIVLMRLVGIDVVVVHGGGPQIDHYLDQLGIESERIDGLRVTDEQTMDIVRMTLTGKVNPELVAAINVHGRYAVGLSGADARMLVVEPLDPRLGFVGEIVSVDPHVIQGILDAGEVPVIAGIGVDDAGRAYNINADTAAAAIAAALGAAKLVYLTNVAGLYRDFPDESSLVSEISIHDARKLLASGAVGTGMIPKVESCIQALEAGVERAHIVDGRRDHVLLLEFFTREGIGTMITGPAA